MVVLAGRVGDGDDVIGDGSLGPQESVAKNATEIIHIIKWILKPFSTINRGIFIEKVLPLALL